MPCPKFSGWPHRPHNALGGVIQASWTGRSFAASVVGVLFLGAKATRQECRIEVTLAVALRHRGEFKYGVAARVG